MIFFLIIDLAQILRCIIIKHWKFYFWNVKRFFCLNVVGTDFLRIILYILFILHLIFTKSEVLTSKFSYPDTCLLCHKLSCVYVERENIIFEHFDFTNYNSITLDTDQQVILDSFVLSIDWSHLVNRFEVFYPNSRICKLM